MILQKNISAYFHFQKWRKDGSWQKILRTIQFKFLTTIIIIISSFLSSIAQYPHAVHNTLTEAEKQKGWELLFDGKTFNGWRGFGLDKAPEGWIIEDETIKIVPKTDWPRQADGQPILGADLITVETFDNFELVWEWKIGTGGNSGIKYNVSEELSLAYPPKGCALGFEYQMMDDNGLSGPAMRNSTGALYDLVPPGKEKLLNPIWKFNISRIVFKGNHGEHWLNGKKVLEFDMNSASFNSFVKNSKFASIPGFAEKRKGHIVLQDHAEAAWFRNIKIRRLIE